MLDRRRFLTTTAAASGLVACAHAPKAEPKDDGDEDVTPAEDLMREHGVLRRVMYLYDEAATRLDAGRDVPIDAVGAAAGIIRRVIEDYHERLEENFLFPRFEKAGKLADLTAILRRQHEKGRAITAEILKLDRAQLAAQLRAFNHMYRPHAAREDTVLFPEIRGLLGAHAYDELGEQFEAEETKALGDHGFEHAVVDVAKLEAAFGIDFAAL